MYRQRIYPGVGQDCICKRKYRVDDDSGFDSLELAQRALASGEEVQAEGSYYF